MHYYEAVKHTKKGLLVLQLHKKVHFLYKYSFFMHHVSPYSSVFNFLLLIIHVFH